MAHKVPLVYSLVWHVVLSLPDSKPRLLQADQIPILKVGIKDFHQLSSELLSHEILYVNILTKMAIRSKDHTGRAYHSILNSMGVKTNQQIAQ